jgi:hypothetical protein
MKRISAALAVAALIGFAGERAAAQSRGLGALAGTVTEEGGAGIGGVLVKLPLPDGSSIEAKTDDSGKWNVNGVGKGEFHMVIYKVGFATKTIKLIVEKETMLPEPVNITLKKSLFAPPPTLPRGRVPVARGPAPLYAGPTARCGRGTIER